MSTTRTSDAELTSLLDDVRMTSFASGMEHRAADYMGAHAASDGSATHFAVWAPNASAVHVIGDFNGWTDDDRLDLRGHSGIWSGVVDGAAAGQRYKFRITTGDGRRLEKSDPFAFATEVPPLTASIITAGGRSTDVWTDQRWMADRPSRQGLDRPWSIYELHLGSWLPRHDDGTFPSYRDLAAAIAEHVHRLGFTHVELMPVTEHPFHGSWGYQTTGYFAPTSRFGSPEDFAAFVDTLHGADIGVLLDWVPSHFPGDAHGLAVFDGTHLFEHADPRMGHHPDWDSCIFNYGRNEVRSFLISSACHWLERFHLDGIRVDAVASMLYRDYSRREGEWIPNDQGGRENWEAVHFLRSLNSAVYREFPGVQTIAEESTSWPMVSRPVDMGGLGFGMKWDMGWMHDTLQYMRHEPVHREFHHHDMTFRSVYATSENFVLALSHDEVVHGKRSLVRQMPGDDWQQRANLRALYGYQWTAPGKKLIFAGDEMAMDTEWNHDGHLPLELLADATHGGVARWIGDLNECYTATPALYELDFDDAGFEWIVSDDAAQSVFAFLRWDRSRSEPVVVVMNETPVVRTNYRLGVPVFTDWDEVLNSDDVAYGGSGVGNGGRVPSRPVSTHGCLQSVVLTLPPLGVIVLRPVR